MNDWENLDLHRCLECGSADVTVIMKQTHNINDDGSPWKSAQEPIELLCETCIATFGRPENPRCTVIEGGSYTAGWLKRSRQEYEAQEGENQS